MEKDDFNVCDVCQEEDECYEYDENGELVFRCEHCLMNPYDTDE